MKRSAPRRRSSGKKPDSFQGVIAEVRRFRSARDRAQFHTPKNLAAAIAIEAAELQELFLWKTDEEIDKDLKVGSKRDAVIEELADTMLFALLLADRLDIDVSTAIAEKLARNAEKYPVALARGTARKYTELGSR